ncbi:hypothetical protein FIV42_24845 [Persicimonas caeni]|uniref:Uncharacterized protein n=1 Tax=Persicimonas caeni TaxID=2292766 RepID=A0A4Y6Q002_PERCE|nr:hypothetical protein [Persicimonas caeni]QDG53852.1 hypothetical protein FIV42_24845 [Persicimonas caeni]QED35073.1 hypothetical protein FRD00_24840 [Persicimonas caeni]
MALFKDLDKETTLKAIGRVVIAIVGAAAILLCLLLGLGGVLVIADGEGSLAANITLLFGVVITGYGGYRLMRKGLDGSHGSKAEQSQTEQRSPQIQVDPSRQSSEREQREALRMARDMNGHLTVAELALDTSLDIDAARTLLDELVDDGVADLQLTDSGSRVYVFPAFVDGGRGKFSARSMLDDDAEIELEFEKLAAQQKQNKD